MKHPEHILRHRAIGERRVKEAAFLAVNALVFPTTFMLASRNRPAKRYQYLIGNFK